MFAFTHVLETSSYSQQTPNASDSTPLQLPIVNRALSLLVLHFSSLHHPLRDSFKRKYLAWVHSRENVYWLSLFDKTNETMNKHGDHCQNDSNSSNFRKANLYMRCFSHMWSPFKPLVTSLTRYTSILTMLQAWEFVTATQLFTCNQQFSLSF